MTVPRYFLVTIYATNVYQGDPVGYELYQAVEENRELKFCSDDKSKIDTFFANADEKGLEYVLINEFAKTTGAVWQADGWS